ncbi:MAG: hypothetical protein HQL16_06265, partial [Candidatus Omnitrophica bacterium]|nr:hypothetical protein [Candidatus Omnitrophota bacterium]
VGAQFIAPGTQAPGRGNNESQELAKQVIREVVIPEIEKEVNEGQNFAPLRQMFYAMILASWYKLALKDAFLNQVYANKNKTSGVLSDDPAVKEKIYSQYLDAYKKGVFNYIKESTDTATGAAIPRKYFSGGLQLMKDPAQLIERAQESAPGDETETIGDMALVSANVTKQDSAMAHNPQAAAAQNLEALLRSAHELLNNPDKKVVKDDPKAVQKYLDRLRQDDIWPEHHENMLSPNGLTDYISGAKSLRAVDTVEQDLRNGYLSSLIVALRMGYLYNWNLDQVLNFFRNIYNGKFNGLVQLMDLLSKLRENGWKEVSGIANPEYILAQKHAGSDRNRIGDISKENVQNRFRIFGAPAQKDGDFLVIDLWDSQVRLGNGQVTGDGRFQVKRLTHLYPGKNILKAGIGNSGVLYLFVSHVYTRGELLKLDNVDVWDVRSGALKIDSYGPGWTPEEKVNLFIDSTNDRAQAADLLQNLDMGQKRNFNPALLRVSQSHTSRHGGLLYILSPLNRTNWVASLSISYRAGVTRLSLTFVAGKSYSATIPGVKPISAQDALAVLSDAAMIPSWEPILRSAEVLLNNSDITVTKADRTEVRVYLDGLRKMENKKTPWAGYYEQVLSTEGLIDYIAGAKTLEGLLASQGEENMKNMLSYFLVALRVGYLHKFDLGQVLKLSGIMFFGKFKETGAALFDLLSQLREGHWQEVPGIANPEYVYMLRYTDTTFDPVTGIDTDNVQNRFRIFGARGQKSGAFLLVDLWDHVGWLAEGRLDNNGKFVVASLGYHHSMGDLFKAGLADPHALYSAFSGERQTEMPLTASPSGNGRSGLSLTQALVRVYQARDNLGGIDLNAKNMGLDVERDGKGRDMTFDPALLEQFTQGNFSGVVPVIIRIMPIQSLLK